MAYSQQIIDTVKHAPKTLGNQLGRWAVHLDFPVTKIAKATGASRQSVVEVLLTILKSSSTADDAWRKVCKQFDLPT
jgi:predicted regulator of amino acid metabolism with ACT domain